MKSVLLTVLVGLAMAGVARGEPELKGAPKELAGYLSAVPGEIRISAMGEATAEATHARVRLRVFTRDKLLAKALEKNRKIRDDIVQTLIERGMTKAVIQVSKFSSSPVFGLFNTGKRPDLYEIESSVDIRAANEDEVQTVAGLVDTKPEVTLQSLRFEHGDAEALQLKAVQDALAKINSQRQQYEKVLDVTLRARGVPYTPKNQPRVPGSQAVITGGLRAFDWEVGDGEGGEDIQFMISALAQKRARPEISQFDQIQARTWVVLSFEVVPRMAKP